MSHPTFAPLEGLPTYTWAAVAAALVASVVIYRSQQTRSNIATMQTDRNAVHRTPSSEVKPPPPGQVSVSKIFIHPIKSCRGTSVQHARYYPEGLENDRRWCIIDATTHAVITAREFPKMVLITPRIELDAASPHNGTLKVSFPEESECETFSIPLQPTQEVLQTWELLTGFKVWPTGVFVDGYICETLPKSQPSPSTILSKYFGKPVQLLYKGPRPRPLEPTTTFPSLKGTFMYQDGYPLLVLSEESTVAVDQQIPGYIGTQGISESWRSDKVIIERFRPNIVIRGGGPFAEDHWEEIAIGSADTPPITLVSRCVRCLLPNVSPGTGERDKAVPYKVLMKFRTGLDDQQMNKPCVGCNGVPQASGIVRVGDPVFVRKMGRYQ